MSPLLSVPFVVRSRRVLPLWMSALALVAVAGCGHSRSAMRPVYVTPTPALNAAPCPTTVDGGIGEPGLAVPADADAAVGPAGGLSSPPSRSSSVSGGGTSTPPRPAAPIDEPSLDLKPADPSASQTNPPSLVRPQGTSSTRSGQSSGCGRIRETSLRSLLTPQGRPALEVCRPSP
jgi:hypothetical protein